MKYRLNRRHHLYDAETGFFDEKGSRAWENDHGLS